MQPRLSILLVGRIYQEQQVLELILKVIQHLSKNFATDFYFLDSRTLEKVLQKQLIMANQVNFYQFDKNNKKVKINYLITIGGDGTILYAAKQFPQQAPPIISFQRGTLGFMCRFQQQQIEQVINELCDYQNKKDKGQKFPFNETQIMRLKTEQRKRQRNGQIVQQFQMTCINQVCICRKECERIVLQIIINNQKITQTSGDGILISTPTGSTAYSLSAGGPIMQNGVNSILITPIAPNSLSFRPICVPSNTEITIKLSSKSRSAGYISYDGQGNFNFGQGDEVQITKSQHGIKFLQPNENMNKMPSWMQRLKFFLGWNQVFKYPQCKYRK